DRRRFRIVVLDPPALAKGRRDVDAAIRAYKEINLRALRIVEPDGWLVTCSCSGRVTPAAFEAMLAHPARDARRAAPPRARRGARPPRPPRRPRDGVPQVLYPEGAVTLPESLLRGFASAYAAELLAAGLTVHRDGQFLPIAPTLTPEVVDDDEMAALAADARLLLSAVVKVAQLTLG